VSNPLVVGCALATLTALPLSACSLTESNKKDDDKGNGSISVTSSDKECELSATKAGSGTVTFKVKNTGGKVTEFYLYAEDGKRIVGEVENIGPGLTRDLVVTAAPGEYVTACKPGMEGDGIRGDFTVTDSGKASSASEAELAMPESVTVKSPRMPSPSMPGLHAVTYSPGAAVTTSSRVRPGPMFSTSPTICSPSSAYR
jgi:iron uptake system EfeUOB component EfeO/EfeM